VKSNHVVLHDETVRQLNASVRGSNSYTLIHTVTLTSNMAFVPDMCPEKQSSVYVGYNVSDVVGFVNLEMYSKVWQARVQTKRDIYGANTVTLKYVGDQYAYQPRKHDELQPVFYHQLPTELYLEVIHSVNVVGVLVLTVGGDSWHKLV
ncbi:MAG: hypothetical protein ACKPKO_33375, partial [Candidatus Fonsibacter sp.]